ncbi:hypothetical protein BV22DRAFT_728056 [Leucogyrophana mollusca]|uniref:Uncharacterized protein n=1 Tax=Leucogyrophana mollusca TaxID=85980 RepID=A0ACB8B7E1_9AGAM|nr:hypothetical protein BV22DRAFT_728056 [Leucogyrophana mollusca]
MDAPREDLPRISFESLQDWKRVQNNLETALRARVDRELAARGLSSDEDKFLPHISQFLDAVSEIARPNLRINGRNFEDLPEDEDEFEPFDEALDRHIWSLSNQRLRWDREIATRRRGRPQEIATLLQQNFLQHRALEPDLSMDRPDDPDSHMDGKLVFAKPLRGNFLLGSLAAPEDQPLEIEDTFSKSASMAAQLLQLIATQQERARGLKSVAGHIKSLKS